MNSLGRNGEPLSPDSVDNHLIVILMRFTTTHSIRGELDIAGLISAVGYNAYDMRKMGLNS